jgi:hypothetical protein
MSRPSSETRLEALPRQQHLGWTVEGATYLYSQEAICRLCVLKPIQLIPRLCINIYLEHDF